MFVTIKFGSYIWVVNIDFEDLEFDFDCVKSFKFF
jgi:hypothetical protein